MKTKTTITLAFIPGRHFSNDYDAPVFYGRHPDGTVYGLAYSMIRRAKSDGSSHAVGEEMILRQVDGSEVSLGTVTAVHPVYPHRRVNAYHECTAELTVQLDESFPWTPNREDA